ncbi:MAG: hypothetical protein ACKPKO_18945, partial [Candidatus Fonsibacter sp.]
MRLATQMQAREALGVVAKGKGRGKCKGQLKGRSAGAQSEDDPNQDDDNKWCPAYSKGDCDKGE